MPSADAEARNWMIDGQLLTNKITDPKLLAAMATVPRERFVPAPFIGTAYVDEEIPLAGNRMLMEPLVLARLLQSLELAGSERVLIVGGATGYSAALVAHLAAEVVMVEESAAFVEQARAATSALGLRNVETLLRRLEEAAVGLPSFDAILIEGAVQQVPRSIIAALREGGRLAYVENRALRPAATGRAATGLGTLMAALKRGGQVTASALTEAGVTLLPGFARHETFQFS
ncbi:MAG: protein-L-isoaspartate O-methyltransferase [Alphaproteobacteria bacterium]